MCRGLALGYNVKTKKMICKGISSHTKTLEKHEDDCIKLEILATDKNERKFLVELDEQYNKSDDILRRFSPWITKSWEISKKLNDVIEHWILDNELLIYKSLVNLQSHAVREGTTDNSYQKTVGNTYNSYQKTGGNTYNSNQKTGGNTNNSSQKTGGNTNNCHQETGENTYNSYQKTGGNTYNNNQATKANTDNSYQKTVGNTYNNNQETEGNTYNSNQKTGGNTYNSSQKTGGDTLNCHQETGENTYNSYQKTVGDTYNVDQKTGGEWYMGCIELSKYPNTTKLIREIRDSWKLTIVEAFSWIIDNPKKAKDIMGAEKSI